jgi:hypothetical protein
MRRIIGKAVSVQKRGVFVGKPFAPMVYLLVSDVIPNVAILEGSDAERAIPMLPAEIPPMRKTLMNPLRRCCLYTGDQLGQGEGAWRFEIEMNMIPGASRAEQLSTTPRNPGGDACIQPRSPLRIEPRSTVSGGQDQMDPQRQVRVSHSQSEIS